MSVVNTTTTSYTMYCKPRLHTFCTLQICHIYIKFKINFIDKNSFYYLYLLLKSDLEDNTVILLNFYLI